MKTFIIFLLFSSATAVRFGCRFSDDNIFSLIGRAYACTVTSFDNSENSTDVTGIYGTHLSGRSNSDVRVVQFSSNFCQSSNLHAVPKGFSKFFNNLIGLSFTSCDIKNLVGDELDEYENLQWWSLLYSTLSRVPSNFFDLNPQMKYINFGFNKIEFIGEGLLSNLTQLQYANFRQNICIDKFADTPLNLQALIEAIDYECPDVCEFENIEEFTCDVREEVLELRRQVRDLKDRVQILEDFMNGNEVEDEKIKKL